VSDYTQGITWLKDNWVDGHPPLGWHDTLCYLVLPVLLVISQYVSTALLTPKTDDPAQQQSQAILKFLPLMIGWFSLNVPSGLGLYWLTNNVVTTATTLLVRRSVGEVQLVGAGTGPVSAGAVAEPPKPQGFARRYGEVIQTTSDSGTKVTIKTPGATGSVPSVAAPDGAAAAGGEVVSVAAEAVPDASAVPASQPKSKKKKKSKKGKKK